MSCDFDKEYDECNKGDEAYATGSSKCCGEPMYGDSDICSGCGEHAEAEEEDFCAICGGEGGTHNSCQMDQAGI